MLLKFLAWWNYFSMVYIFENTKLEFWNTRNIRAKTRLLLIANTFLLKTFIYFSNSNMRMRNLLFIRFHSFFLQQIHYHLYGISMSNHLMFLLLLLLPSWMGRFFNEAPTTTPWWVVLDMLNAKRFFGLENSNVHTWIIITVFGPDW